MKLKFFICLCISLGLLLCWQAETVDASKILAVYPFPGKSHFMMTNALIKELIQKGHEVTMVTGMTLKHLKLGSNYTEILIEPEYDIWADLQEVFQTDNVYDLSKMHYFDFVEMLKVMGLRSTEHALMQSNVQALINAPATEGVYDLLLIEQFYNEAFLALAYKYNIPVITSSTRSFENSFSQLVGIVTPWSFVPHGSMPFTDRMNFIERLKNSFYSLYDDIYREWHYFPKVDEQISKFFSQLKIKIPKASVMEKEIAALLVNAYPPLVTARPQASNMIPVGGLHIYPNEPLPADLQEFLDGAKHGAIYFSLGSNVLGKDMPADKLKIFLEVFASLKQRVIWKFEDDSIKNLPKNVMIKKWLPQNDILAHPNTKVFITHGGLFGSQEAINFAVPMLGMPFYCDQFLNINKVVQSGYALSLHFPTLTKEQLRNALTELITNPKYKTNIDSASEIFRDRPMSPRESAVYWIEYVIKHKGAKHLRSAGQDLKWYQYYLLDVILFVVATLMLTLFVLYLLVKLLFKPNNVQKHKKS